MPRYKNGRGEWEYVDAIFNSSTMINRENVGQVFELSLNHIGEAIVNRIISERMNLNEAYSMIYKFVSMCSPEQAAYMQQRVSEMTPEEFMFYIESIVNSGSIQLSMKPISESFTIDKLMSIYDAFPWIEQNTVEVAMVGSDGSIRYVPCRRKVVIGKQYIYKLKQYSEEKFSATSLSSTNIRNENTKSRVKKDFKELYPNTPIRFGNMETNNMAHIGVDALITNMMIHSLSPQGRRLTEQMYTGDPFHIDIKLDSDSKNRSAEIANTYLKTVGRRILFIKKKKKIQKITMSPISFDRDPYEYPITFLQKDMREGFDWVKDFEERQKINKLKEKCECPLRFEGIDRRRKDED